MIQLEISREVKKVCPDIRLGIIQSVIEYQKENRFLWQEINKIISQTRKSLKKEEIVNLPLIQHTRQAYLAMGKEPARYRCSAEALLRRIARGKDLYRINNVVDIINSISLSSGFSIGCYDVNQLIAPLIFDIGKSDEIFHAIGRGSMNIENLPVLKDQIGPFGSPTSDSERSMITEKTTDILIVIFDFHGEDALGEALDRTSAFLEHYAGAGKIEKEIMESDCLI